MKSPTKFILFSVILCSYLISVSLEVKSKLKNEGGVQKSLFETLKSEQSPTIKQEKKEKEEGSKNLFDTIAFSQIKQTPIDTALKPAEPIVPSIEPKETEKKTFENDEAKQLQKQINQLTKKAESLSKQLAQMKKQPVKTTINKFKDEITSLQDSWKKKEEEIHNQISSYLDESTQRNEMQQGLNKRFKKKIHYNAKRVDSLQMTFATQIKNFQMLLENTSNKVNSFLKEINQKESILQKEIDLNKKNIETVKNLMMSKLQDKQEKENDNKVESQIKQISLSVKDLSNKLNKMSKKYTNIIKKQELYIREIQNNLNNAGIY